MQLLLHIGISKTGTTSLQKWLAEACTPVRGDVFIPDAALLPGTRFGNHLGMALYSGADRVWGQQLLADTRNKLPPEYRSLGLAAFQRAYERDLVRSIDVAAQRGCGRLLLSNEHLSERLSPPEIRDFSSRLDRLFAEKTLVLYLREQVAAYVSLYCETVKYGRRQRFARFADESWVHRFFDYEALLTNWKSAGWRLQPRIYREAHARTREWDLITDFEQTIWPGFRSTGDAAERGSYRENVSQAAGAYAVVRLVNSRHVRPSWRRRLITFASRYPTLTRRFHARNAAIFEAIRARHAAGNARIAREYFERDVLFDLESGAGVLGDRARRTENETRLE